VKKSAEAEYLSQLFESSVGQCPERDADEDGPNRIVDDVLCDQGGTVPSQTVSPVWRRSRSFSLNWG